MNKENLAHRLGERANRLFEFIDTSEDINIIRDYCKREISYLHGTIDVLCESEND